jgi:hypothetical protein
MSMVLLKSPPAPLPVLLFAVLVKSVTAPTAALNLYIALEGKRTNRCVKCAAGKVKQGALLFRCVSPGLTPSGGGLTACILWARNKPTNASATRMRTNAKPRMVVSELLEVVIVFMPAVSFFGLIVFTS